MNNEINQTATDMNNLASDTQQAGTGIGQSSPNIDLNAIGGAAGAALKGKEYQEEKELEELEQEELKQEEVNTRTHGDIMSEIQKNESELDKINEYLEAFRNASTKGHQSPIANQLDKRKSELLNSIKELKENESFDNRTDEQRRSDKLLADQREREDTTAQRGTQDMLKAGLHPASANYGGSIGGSSGSGGGGGGSENEKEKERRRRRKKLLEKIKRERERERRQNITNILSRVGSAATYGAMRNNAFKSKNMNNTTNTISGPLKKHKDNPDWLQEYMDEINAMDKPKSNNSTYFEEVAKIDKNLSREEHNKEINRLKDKYNM